LVVLAGAIQDEFDSGTEDGIALLSVRSGEFLPSAMSAFDDGRYEWRAAMLTLACTLVVVDDEACRVQLLASGLIAAVASVLASDAEVPILVRGLGLLRWLVRKASGRWYLPGVLQGIAEGFDVDQLTYHDDPLVAGHARALAAEAGRWSAFDDCAGGSADQSGVARCGGG
jgi:hypothetical protein